MGLGKTIQTLSFLATLKQCGMSGPHLVVTPLAVLINWTNEIKKFTPGMSFVKVHGCMQERDRILSDEQVLAGEFDIYLTTYETMMSEEAFFTESLLFHTITIDEGHRLKNENSMLCKSLGRLSSPWRLLLTGTPLQNNLHELWALLNYVIPGTLNASVFDDACDMDQGQVDSTVVSKSRMLLEAMMIRRVKADVERTLLPKIEYTIRVPLTSLQRTWYRRIMDKDQKALGLLSQNQLLMMMMQLQKVCNHPKCIQFQYERDQVTMLLPCPHLSNGCLYQEAAKSFAKRAAGSEFIKIPQAALPLGADSATLQKELCGLEGQGLIDASGKLGLLDRLLDRIIPHGSRALIFSQYTLCLDVLELYCKHKFGENKYLRLDGSTNRICREMDVRSFNAHDSKYLLYLISTKAGGQGINLATANTVALYDTSWNPQVDLQAQDRAHRIGQKKQVTIYRLVCEDTFEERVLARARQKLILDAMVIKKGGGNHVVAQGEDEQMSLGQLWGILSCGADRVFDPTHRDQGLTRPDYDKLLDSAKSGVVLLDYEDLVEEKEACAVQPAMEFNGPAPKGDFECSQCGAKKAGRASKCANINCNNHLKRTNCERSGVLDEIPRPRGRCPTGQTWDGVNGKWTWSAASGIVQEAELGKRNRTEPRRFVPVEYRPDGSGKPKLRNYDHCFICHQRGDLLACDQCPQVYHLECLGLTSVPKGCFRCPWHACSGCERRASSVGGMLFHCRTCPEAFCFDCAPDKYLDPASQKNNSTSRLVDSLEYHGCSAKQYLWYTCDTCVSTSKPLNVHHSMPKPRPPAMPKPSTASDAPEKQKINVQSKTHPAHIKKGSFVKFDQSILDSSQNEALIEAFELRESESQELHAWRDYLDRATLCAVERANGIGLTLTPKAVSDARCCIALLVGKLRSRLTSKQFNIDALSLSLATVTQSCLTSRGLQHGLLKPEELTRAATLLERFEAVLVDPNHRRENGKQLTSAGVCTAVLHRLPLVYQSVQVRDVLDQVKNPVKVRDVMQALTAWLEALDNPLTHDQAVASCDHGSQLRADVPRCQSADVVANTPDGKHNISELEMSLNRLISRELVELRSLNSSGKQQQLILTPSGVTVCKAESLQRPPCGAGRGAARLELAACLKQRVQSLYQKMPPKAVESGVNHSSCKATPFAIRVPVGVDDDAKLMDGLTCGVESTPMAVDTATPVVETRASPLGCELTAVPHLAEGEHVRVVGLVGPTDINGMDGKVVGATPGTGAKSRKLQTGQLVAGVLAHWKKVDTAAQQPSKRARTAKAAAPEKQPPKKATPSKKAASKSAKDHCPYCNRSRTEFGSSNSFCSHKSICKKKASLLKRKDSPKPDARLSKKSKPAVVPNKCVQVDLVSTEGLSERQQTCALDNICDPEPGALELAHTDSAEDTDGGSWKIPTQEELFKCPYGTRLEIWNDGQRSNKGCWWPVVVAKKLKGTNGPYGRLRLKYTGPGSGYTEDFDIDADHFKLLRHILRWKEPPRRSCLVINRI